MFKIITNPQFTHPVTVNVPVDGGHREETFKARFQVVDQDETEDLDLGTRDGLSDYLRKVWIGVEDVLGENDTPVLWSDELRDRMLQLPYVRLGLLRTYTGALTGARAGN